MSERSYHGATSRSWLEREIAQWVHSLKDWSDDPSHHERTLLPRSYISLLAGTRNSSMGPLPWRIDPTTHRTMSERSYHGVTSRSDNERRHAVWLTLVPPMLLTPSTRMAPVVSLYVRIVLYASARRRSSLSQRWSDFSNWYCRSSSSFFNSAISVSVEVTLSCSCEIYK